MLLKNISSWFQKYKLRYRIRQQMAMTTFRVHYHMKDGRYLGDYRVRYGWLRSGSICPNSPGVPCIFFRHYTKEYSYSITLDQFKQIAETGLGEHPVGRLVIGCDPSRNTPGFSLGDFSRKELRDIAFRAEELLFFIF